MHHLIEAQQFNKKKLRELFDLCDRMGTVLAQGGCTCLEGKVMASLFFVPSMRTRFSFEAAMLRLGGRVLSTETAGAFSSEVKGGFEDTIRVVSELADVIVLRHRESGSARRAAKVAGVPVINAGDGSAQHPTQALLDLYTIDHHLGSVDGCSIVMVGDLTSRSVRSLCYFLAKFHGVRVSFVSPDVTTAKDDIKSYLRDNDVQFTEITNPGTGLEDVLREINADVVYLTQLTKEDFGERYEDYEKSIGLYNFGLQALTNMRKTTLVMHPLPRGMELPQEVDSDSRAVYIRQTRYGLCLRMAIFCTMLGRYPNL